MLNSSSCDCNDVYIHVNGTIAILNTGTAATPNRKNKNLIFKNCAQFTDCISKINKTYVDNAKKSVGVKPMHNLREYSDIYSTTSGSLW